MIEKIKNIWKKSLQKLNESFWEIVCNKKNFRNAIIALWLFSSSVAWILSYNEYKSYEKDLISDTIQVFRRSTKLLVKQMEYHHSPDILSKMLDNIKKNLFDWKVTLTTSEKYWMIRDNDYDANTRIFIDKLLYLERQLKVDFGVKRDGDCMDCHDTNIWVLSYEGDLSDDVDKIHKSVLWYWASIFLLISLFGWYALFSEKEKRTVKKMIARYERLHEFFFKAPIAMFELVPTEEWYLMQESNFSTISTMPNEFHLLTWKLSIDNEMIKDLFPDGINTWELIKKNGVQTSEATFWWRRFVILVVWNSKNKCLNFYITDITELHRLRQFPENNVHPLYSLSFKDDKFRAKWVNTAWKEAKKIICEKSTVEAEILKKISIEKIKKLIWTAEKSPEFEIVINEKTYKWWLKWVEWSDVVHFYSNDISREAHFLSILLSSEEEEQSWIEGVNIPWLELSLYHESLDRWTRYWWDFFFLIPGSEEWVFRFILGDVSWKWLEAAAVVHDLRKILNEDPGVRKASSPEEILTILNNSINTATWMYATCIAMFLDFNKGLIYTSNAIHPNPMIVNTKRSRIQQGLKWKGLAVWMFDKVMSWFEYDWWWVWNEILGPNAKKCSRIIVWDKIIIFTDWITEAKHWKLKDPKFPDNEGGMEFWVGYGWKISKLEEVIMKNKHLSWCQLQSVIIEEVEVWVWKEWVHDDTLLFILEITPEYKLFKKKNKNNKSSQQPLWDEGEDAQINWEKNQDKPVQKIPLKKRPHKNIPAKVPFINRRHSSNRFG